jgi:hypothetical protein
VRHWEGIRPLISQRDPCQGIMEGTPITIFLSILELVAIYEMVMETIFLQE